MRSLLTSLAFRNVLRGLCAGTFVFSASCGGGGDGATDPGGGGGGGGGGNTPAGFTLAASATSLSVARGATGTVTVTVTRTGSFTGPVSLQPVGMPAGVTALFSLPSVPTGQTQSTLTFTVASTAAAATTTINIIGNGAGVANQTLAVQLTVTAPVQAGPFTMGLSVSSYLALPATILSSPATLTILRNPGITAPVTVSVSGLPPGLVVGVTPTNVTSTTATVLILDGGAAAGTYPVTIRGVITGQGEQSVTFNVVVAPPTTGNVTWTFCENAVRTPRWIFAVKDGAGPWTRIVPNGNSFSFNVVSPTAQVAMVVPEGLGYRTTIYQHTAQEIAARGTQECLNYPGVSQRTATGQTSGLSGGEISFVSVGTTQTGTQGPAPFSLTNLPAGNLDVVAVRTSLNQQADQIPTRFVVRRGINPASGATIAIDYNAAEAVAPTAGTWTYNGANGEAFSIIEYFATARGTAGVLVGPPGIDRTTTARTIYAVPAAQTIPGDLHAVIATVASSNLTIRATRQVIAYSRTVGDRVLTFGPALPAPTVTVVAGAPGGRVRAQGTLPNEYNSGVSMDIGQTASDRYVTINATRGFLGAGNAYDIQVPDLTGVVGWDTSFPLRTGAVATYWVSGGGPALDTFDGRFIFNATRVRFTGATTGITAPADGGVHVVGRVTGTVTP